MASPIKPTPTLYGKEAKLFIEAARINEHKKITKADIRRVENELKLLKKIFPGGIAWD